METNNNQDLAYFKNHAGNERPTQILITTSTLYMFMSMTPTFL